jgi:hypothetical protein
MKQVHNLPSIQGHISRSLFGHNLLGGGQNEKNPFAGIDVCPAFFYGVAYDPCG